MRILVCGSRSVRNKKYVDYVLSQYDPELIISGGADGPDTYAVFYADINNIPFQVIKPDWNKYGKAAGMIRNKEMVDLLDNDDLVLAFWDGKSSGTKNTIDYAKRKGIKVIVNTITYV